MSNKKRIGILTSGGDCGGLNAAIRAVVLASTRKDYEVIGIENGMIGLLEKPYSYRILKPSDFSGSIMRLGGTILGTTNKGEKLKFTMPDGTIKNRSEAIMSAMEELDKDAINDVKIALNELRIEALIGIGGDGSMSMLSYVAEKAGVNFVGIPKTIDNDVGVTENSIGFATAVDVATEALDRLQPTAASHDRIMVLEVMGRDAGNIAISAGISGGADVILIPEIPYDFEKVVEKIKRIRKDENRKFALIIVSEAIKDMEGETVHQEHANNMKKYGGVGHYVSDVLQKMTGFEARTTVLGHVQRGCPPIPYDRMIATAFGVAAVDLIVANKFNRMVAWSNREVIDIPIKEAIASYQDVDVNGSLVRTARSLGICMGD